MKTHSLTFIGFLMLCWLAPSRAATAITLPAHTKPGSLTCLSPAPPIINGERNRICRGETVALDAVGCLGTVIWSTGERGPGIRMTPHQTTAYTAVCRLAEGCVSCFAEAYTVTVGTPDAPTLTTDQPLVCAGDAVTLQVGDCAGQVRWSEAGLTGPSVTVRLTQTTVYRATCVQAGCAGSPSRPLTAQVATPTIPTLTRVSGAGDLCAGQSVQFTADQCLGQVRWSDGATGSARVLTPSQTIRLRAVCRVGSCQSDSSDALTLTVQPGHPTRLTATTVTNTCPFQTADLTWAVGAAFDPSFTYEFRRDPAPASPEVASPGAVGVGVYYVSARSAVGCLSVPVAVTALITPCLNGLAPCLSSPPAVSLRLDSLDQQRGVVCVSARLRGVIPDGFRPDAAWTCSGTGLFTGQRTLSTRYVAAEADRQAGPVTFALSTPDPDGPGPCQPARAHLTVTILSVNSSIPTDSTHLTDKVADVPEDGRIFIPEGFSPNGDGLNDRFVIRGVPATATVELEIFNRWGNRVYASADYKNDWEGQPNQGVLASNSQGLPDGTYFYVARVSDGREYVRFLILAR